MKQILAFAIVAIAAIAAGCSPQAETPPAPAPTIEELKVAAIDPCLPAGYDRAALDALKTADFEIADEAARQAFAKAITGCLASYDSTLRDGIAYEALTRMLRGKQLSADTMHALKADLTARLGAPEGDGFERPFAALVLSEVARADRIEAFLTQDELVKLLIDAQAWFINIHDYRGFDEGEGWRHGVAHGADLLMQLSLNPRIDKEGLGVIVSAVGVQVAPKGVSYIDGESERLARPILFAASRGVMTEAQWSEWLKQLATPPANIADKLFTSVNGLAWRHDTKAFLNALYAGVTLDADKDNDVMRAGLEGALKAMS